MSCITYTLDDGSEDVKFIGVYSSDEMAQEAIERLSVQPSFCAERAGFVITRYKLDQDNQIEGYVTVR